MDHRVHRVNEDLRVQPEGKEIRGTRVLVDHLELKGPKGREEMQEQKALLDHRDQSVRRGNLGFLASLGILDLKETRVRQDLLVRQARPAPGGTLERMVSRARREKMATRGEWENLDQWASWVLEACLGSRELKVLQGLQDPMDLWEKRGSLAPLETLDLQDQKVLREQSDQEGSEETPGGSDQPVKWDKLDQRGMKDPKESPVRSG